MKNSELASNNRYVKIYHGYGHAHDLQVFGHVLADRPVTRKKYSSSYFANIIHLLRLFFVKPIPLAPLTLEFNSQTVNGKSETDGFFKFEWAAEGDVPAGWHEVAVAHQNDGATIENTGEIFVPHITQFGFISDIDDTVMVSHSATIGKRLRALFTANPRTREVFPDVGEHYSLLSMAHTEPEAPNPFFYVSSSEWNLYDYLLEVFRFNKLPEGAFLLNQIKRWYQLFKTGKTTHEGKLLRVLRILDAFPNQKFILLGDSTQSDPAIYHKIAEKYPDRIHAVYIRNVHKPKEEATRTLLNDLSNKTGIQCCFFIHSNEAIAHSRSIGLID
ncbi:MAG: DUF2183 domain-containing protein [Gemmatimonadaceae bacterium]|nr:DUF2183 domain-containing protein [Chitinophagaceae bacterium]